MTARAQAPKGGGPAAAVRVSLFGLLLLNVAVAGCLGTGENADARPPLRVGDEYRYEVEGWFSISAPRGPSAFKAVRDEGPDLVFMRDTNVSQVRVRVGETFPMLNATGHAVVAVPFYVEVLSRNNTWYWTHTLFWDVGRAVSIGISHEGTSSYGDHPTRRLTYHQQALVPLGIGVPGLRAPNDGDEVRLLSRLSTVDGRTPLHHETQRLEYLRSVGDSEWWRMHHRSPIIGASGQDSWSVDWKISPHAALPSLIVLHADEGARLRLVDHVPGAGPVLSADASRLPDGDRRLFDHMTPWIEPLPDWTFVGRSAKEVWASFIDHPYWTVQKAEPPEAMIQALVQRSGDEWDFETLQEGRHACYEYRVAADAAAGGPVWSISDVECWDPGESPINAPVPWTPSQSRFDDRDLDVFIDICGEGTHATLLSLVGTALLDISPPAPTHDLNGEGYRVAAGVPPSILLNPEHGHLIYLTGFMTDANACPLLLPDRPDWRAWVIDRE